MIGYVVHNIPSHDKFSFLGLPVAVVTIYVCWLVVQVIQSGAFVCLCVRTITVKLNDLI